MEILDYLSSIDNITDALINGPNDLQVDRGSGLEQVDFRGSALNTAADVRRLALELARLGNVRLDEAMPIADAELPGGIRLHAVLAPIAHRESGALISLRFHAKTVLTLNQLCVMQMFTPKQAKLLRRLVFLHKNIVISGATGTGKTTLMSSLIHTVSKKERLICVEEAREISPTLHPGLVFLTARKANTEGAGEVTLAELMKATLRMRPDRVILGECRGNEVKEYLLGLNTGHSGSFTTVHANSAEDVLVRLQMLGVMAGLPADLVEMSYRSAVDAVIHIVNYAGRRKIAKILDVSGWSLQNEQE